MADYSTLLRERVTLAGRSVDRIFLQGYVPHLQTAGWCARFLREQRGFGYPSSKAFGEVGKAYETAIRNFARKNAIPVIRFARGDNREEIARPYLEAAAAGGKGKVVMIGVGQENASAWRSWANKRRDSQGRGPGARAGSFLFRGTGGWFVFLLVPVGGPGVGLWVTSAIARGISSFRSGAGAAPCVWGVG